MKSHIVSCLALIASMSAAGCVDLQIEKKSKVLVVPPDSKP